MNKTDISNNEIIKNIVQKHFSLDDSSLDFFKKEIDNRSLIPFYQKLYENSKDLRLTYELPREKCEILDAGWSLFKNIFPNFVASNSLTYINFVENKVLINKNYIKLRKALMLFYFDKEKGIKNLAKDFGISSCSGESDIKAITNHIDKYLDKISQDCLPKSNSIKLIISLNFADWFLCSTAENWKSCLNLESEFHAAYWTGLPGLIGDKNRCMVYITDGSKKSYHGIVVDKIIARSWGILSDKNIVGLIKPYPLSNLFNANTVTEITGINCIDLLQKSPSTKFSSLTNVNLLYFDTKPKKSNFIFQDIVGFSVENTGKIIYYGRNGFYQYREGVLITGEPVVNFSGGLTYLIKNNKVVLDFAVRNCTMCGSPHTEFYTISNEDGTTQTVCICPDCLKRNFYICSECMEIHPKNSSNIIKIKGTTLCKTCFNKYYSYCSDCGGIVRKNRTSKIIGEHKDINYVCDNCIVNYETEELRKCYSCGTHIHKNHAFVKLIKKSRYEMEDTIFCEECFNDMQLNMQINQMQFDY